jgi:Flp pilus assembly protein TadG
MAPARWSQRLLADLAGGPLAEMAVIILPFMLMLALVIEGGNILWHHQVALKSVRDATRYLSRVQPLVTPDCAIDDAVLADAGATAKALAASGRLAGGAPQLPGLTEDAIRIPAPAVVDLAPCQVVVSAIADVTLVLPFSPLFQLVDPASPTTLAYSVGDQARWVGE